MTYQTQYGPIKDKILQSGGFKAPKSPKHSEESDVEKAGYRTLKMQIQELEDSGQLLIELMKQKYPAHE